MLCRKRSCANRVGSKAAELEGKFIVVIPVLSVSPQPCADCLPLFSARPLSIERYTLVIETLVLKLDVPTRQKFKWMDCISRPEALRMVRRVVEVAHIVEDRSERE